MVFAKHANIIVNAGRATAREVLELTAIMKSRVREKFGVELEEEVMFLGEKPRVGREETLGAGDPRAARAARPRRAAS
jgi:hypothetical protein